METTQRTMSLLNNAAVMEAFIAGTANAYEDGSL